MAAESDESAKDCSLKSVIDCALMDTIEQNSPQPKCSRIFPCRFEGCSSVFTKMAHLNRHELIHNDIRPFSCTQDGCGKSFRSKSHLKRHESSHSGEKAFKCEYEDCNVACYNAWSLKRHIKRTHEGTFKCNKCDKEFKKNKMLQDHISLEHKKSVIVCTFPGCTHIFKNQAKMKFHQKLHSGKGYTCPVKGCSEAFALFSECRKHSAECKRKEVKCDICEKVFKYRSNLKAHQKTHESEREVFQCHYPDCKRFYTKKYNLQAHIQSFHQNLQQFECPKPNCSKKFHYKHSLRHHLNNHGKIDEKQSSDKLPKRKRPKRMVTSEIAGITGYIPELMYKLTSAEMNEYVNGGSYDPECLADTDIIPKDYETTQAEMTALSSGNFSCLKTTEDESHRHEVENMSNEPDVKQEDAIVYNDESTELVSDASEETVTASLSADEFVILEPSTIEEISNILDQQFKQNFQHASSSSVSSSLTNSPKPAAYDSNEMNKLNERLQQLARNQLMECNVVLERSCSMQQSVSVKADSDSSDNERVLIQQIV